MLHKEKIPLKLLRLTSSAAHGFILNDYPRSTAEATLLEEFKGGINSFVHWSLPDDVLVDIEEHRHECQDCGKEYFAGDVKDTSRNIRIEKFMPEDGECFDCGSTNIKAKRRPTQLREKTRGL